MSDEVYFIDANIPMYAAGTEHPLKVPCLAILTSVARGELQAFTDTEVLQELLHRYTALGERERAIEICRLFLQVVPDVHPLNRSTIERALELHLQYPQLQARDSVHAAVLSQHKVTHLVSADRHFDGLPGLTRLDPSAFKGGATEQAGSSSLG